MYTVHIIEPNGDIVEEFENCIRVQTVYEAVMREQFSDVYEAIGVRSNFVQVVDSCGNHFFPTAIYTIAIG